MKFSLQTIREMKEDPELIYPYGILDSAVEQNLDEFVDVLAVGGYFPVVLPKSLRGLSALKGTGGLVNWLETNVVPIFSDMEPGKSEFDRVEHRNRKLFAKWVEFARLVREKLVWVHTQQSDRNEYRCVKTVFSFSNSVELLGAYYSRRFAEILEVGDTECFGSHVTQCDSCLLEKECRSGACPGALGSAWPDWLNFTELARNEPNFDLLSRRKRQVWSVMCCMVTLGVIGKTLGSDRLCSFARRAVEVYGALFLLQDDGDSKLSWKNASKKEGGS